ncbi:MAG: hypothetical protein O7F73_01620, partial [Gammaproteobacteria bacterium]|nr:hypothetical protein [Gammaproteobacteria bacterium]
DIHFTSASTELSFWARQDYRPQQSRVSVVEQNINAALAGWPHNPDYLDAKARFLTWQAYWEEQGTLARTLSQQALELKLGALERRPARRQSWVELAGDKARLGQNDASWNLALEKINTLKNVNH